MEPRLTSDVVVSGLDRFVVDVRKMATEARDLLHEPVLSIGHQFEIALIPQLVTMRECPWDAMAIGLDGVFRYEFCLEWRQVPMPVNNLGALVIDCGVHMTPFSAHARDAVIASSRAMLP